MSLQVCFSHGQESGPWGTKIQRLAALARDRGHDVHSMDYRGIADPAERVALLVDWCREREATAFPLVLAGSSMGGYVAARAAATARPAGLFLLAPAFFMPGYDSLPTAGLDCPVEIVHGLGDEVIPVHNSLRFAQQTGATLHAIDGDHRLIDALEQVLALFGVFLDRVG